MNVFIDTSILLDVLANRKPFHDDSAEICTLAETGKISGFISTISLSNLYYVLRRIKGEKIARNALHILRDIFKFIPLDEQIANQALDSNIKDFEYAIQFFSVIRAEAIAIITRYPKDFPGLDIAIQTPKEFLAAHRSKLHMPQTGT